MKQAILFVMAILHAVAMFMVTGQFLKSLDNGTWHVDWPFLMVVAGYLVAWMKLELLIERLKKQGVDVAP